MEETNSMKRISKILAGVLAIATLSFSSSSYSATTVIPTARLVNRTQLELEWSGRKTIVPVDSLNAQILDGVNCQKGTVEPRQTLSGQRFFGNRALAVDPLTGNVAVGVVMQDCFDTFTSAVFVIDPQSPGTYAIYRAQVPGARPLGDQGSTFPLNAIERVRYLDGDLLVRNGSTAVESKALLVFTPGTTPAGKFAGCVVLAQGEGRSLCPAVR
jgi:hypothetical protein